MPVAPDSLIRAETPESPSVMSRTCERPPATRRTRPTRPAPLTTGSPSRTPSLEPLLIVTVEYQTVGERPNTRAVTAPCWSRLEPLVHVRRSARSSRFSRSGAALVDELAAQRVALVAQVLELALGVDRVADPARGVAERA